MIEAITTTPWGEDVAKEEDDHEGEEKKPRADEVPLEPHAEGLPEQQVKDQSPVVKGIYLRRADFQRHGWTEGCPKMQVHAHPSR